MPIDNQPLPGMKPGQETGTPMQATPPAPLKNPKKDKMKLQKPPKNLKDIIDISPTIKEEDKSKSKHSVFAFGRMNPPHAGHQHVVDKVDSVAKKVGAKRGRVVLSHSQDKKKNPLDQKTRMGYIKKMNPANKVRGSSKEHPNFLSYAKKLHKKGTTDLHVVTGSDRKDEFKKTLDKYNNHPDHYSFKSITVHGAGDKRDDKSKTSSGASGTKQREHAKKGDYKSFSKNLPKSLQKHGKEMYGKMREWNEGDWDDLIIEMDQFSDDDLQLIVDNDIITEKVINERVLNLMQRRRAALKMRRMKFRIARARKIKKKRFATMDMLTRRARRQARNFIRKRIAGKQGEKYVDLSPSQKIAIDKRMQKKLPFINKLAKRLLPKVKQAELVRLRAARNRKEGYINSSFKCFLTELSTDWSSDDNSDEQLQANGDQATAGTNEAADPAVKAKQDALKSKHKNETESQKKRHAIEKEKLTAQTARQAQAEIRREAHEVSEAVDVMVDALAALDLKAQKANVELDTLFVEFIEGYQNPHGKQTPQQGGFAAVNKLLAEMSQVEKDKAEDIVKGMKKKASNFRKLYGKDAKSVMYATANKLAQEDMQKFRKEIIEGELEAQGKPLRRIVREQDHYNNYTNGSFQAFTEGGWEGWERFNKKQGRKLEKALTKGRKRGKSKAYQFKRFGNIDDPAIGEAYPVYKTKDYIDRQDKGWKLDPKKATKKQIRSADAKGMLGKARYQAKQRSEQTDVQELVAPAAMALAKYAAPKIGAAVAKKAAPYVAGAAATYGAKKYVQHKMRKKREQKIADKAADQAVAKYKAANESLKAQFEPEYSEAKRRYGNKIRAKIGLKKKPELNWKKDRGVSEDYNATQDAIAHAKRDGANYKKDVSVQHRYDAYHMKKRGFTHRKYGGMGSYSYNKHGEGERITDKHHSGVSEGMGAAYMPDTKEKKTPAREITSKAVLKQLNRNRNRAQMKGKVRTPNVRYVHDRQRETDLTAAERGQTVINPEEPKKGKGHKKGKKGKKKNG